jgi:hypothetical protein
VIGVLQAYALGSVLVPAHVSGATHCGVHVYTLLGSCAGVTGCGGGAVGVVRGVLGTPRCIAKQGAF